jgi:hypothetical protein
MHPTLIFLVSGRIDFLWTGESLFNAVEARFAEAERGRRQSDEEAHKGEREEED